MNDSTFTDTEERYSEIHWEEFEIGEIPTLEISDSTSGDFVGIEGFKASFSVESAWNIVISERINWIKKTIEPGEKEISVPCKTSKISIVELFKNTEKMIPDAEWDKLPKDGAKNHDHYLYGFPKKK